MHVLIAVSRRELGVIWARHLERQGSKVDIVTNQDDAVAFLHEKAVSVIILELTLSEGSALAVSDFASYRQPGAKVIFVNSSHFFTDGSIFRHCANASAQVPQATRPEDLAALAEHLATH